MSYQKNYKIQKYYIKSKKYLQKVIPTKNMSFIQVKGLKFSKRKLKRQKLEHLTRNYSNLSFIICYWAFKKQIYFQSVYKDIMNNFPHSVCC